MKENIIATIIATLMIVGAIFYIVEDAPSKGSFVENNQNNVEVMNYEIKLKTNKGEITFESLSDIAPNTVNNFIRLAEKEFYNGLIFHRIIDGFMIQGGCPEGTGRGGPGYTFDDEIDPNLEIYQGGYEKGLVAMANSGPNTNGSQFFIMVEDYPLSPDYTIFGKVISGQDVADRISQAETDVSDKPLEDIIIEEVVVNKK